MAFSPAACAALLQYRPYTPFVKLVSFPLSGQMYVLADLASGASYPLPALATPGCLVKNTLAAP